MLTVSWNCLPTKYVLPKMARCRSKKWFKLSFLKEKKSWKICGWKINFSTISCHKIFNIFPGQNFCTLQIVYRLQYHLIVANRGQIVYMKQSLNMTLVWSITKDKKLELWTKSHFGRVRSFDIFPNFMSFVEVKKESTT